MNDEVTIVSAAETDLGWEFEVTVDGRLHRVTLPDDYYYQLTGGKVSPHALIEQSFAFLLAREPANNILPEFDLKLINQYFPEFENEITQ